MSNLYRGQLIVCLTSALLSCDTYDPPPGESWALTAPNVFASCCGDLGRCVPSELLTSEERRGLDGDNCSDANALCVPAKALIDREAYVPASCTASVLEMEGRCLPACLPEVQRQAERLLQDGCDDGHLCAPCFDPVTGEPSGACDLGGDPGPIRPALAWPTCCEGIGRCVPHSLIDDDDAMHLGPDTCAEPQRLCVPMPFLEASEFAPPPCTVAEVGAEGRCLPACLPEIAAQAERLSSDGCAAGHLCAPCFDPVTGESTGSCGLGGDAGPTRAPVVFGRCCGGQARCVPEALTPDDQRSQLARDSCEGERELCVPEGFVREQEFVPEACVASALGAEGRCILNCLPAVAEQAAVLERDGCTTGHSCVPCFDPLTGAPTHACESEHDEGPTQGPVVLEPCCDGLGRCAPQLWIPGEHASTFGRDTCSDETTLCVAPEAAVEQGERFIAARCHDALLGAEGRCLLPCLPALAARADALNAGDCAAPQLCVPCFDPISGDPTGACRGPSDPGPSEPPVVLERCCSSSSTSAGLCVPSALLPEGLPELQRETCSDPATACAPRTIIEDPTSALPACSALLTGRGVCIEDCFISPEQRLRLSQADCQAEQRCVPCSTLDPTTPGC